MTYEEIKEIFESTASRIHEIKGDNAYYGLHVLANYTDNFIVGAEHDKIYGPKIDDLLIAGITKEDIVTLAELNWGVSEGHFYCFV